MYCKDDNSMRIRMGTIGIVAKYCCALCERPFLLLQGHSLEEFSNIFDLKIQTRRPIVPELVLARESDIPQMIDRSKLSITSIYSENGAEGAAANRAVKS